MFQRLQYVLLTTALLAFPSAPVSAQDVYVRAAQIDFSAQADVVAVLAEIDGLIAEVSTQTNADQRLVFDLARAKADILIKADRKLEAAGVLSELAALAARFRQELQKNVAALHREAASLLRQTNNNRAARVQLLALLEEQRDGAQPAQVIASTLEEIAEVSDLMNRAAEAKQYRDAAAQALSPDAVPTRGEGVGYREVEVFYATDRARSGKEIPDEFYGWDRGELELGLATVTIPDTHIKGLVEAPSVWRLEFGPSPAKHVVLQSVVPLESEVFFTAMQDRLEMRRNKELFVFVHGYNVQFDQAAKRAAQVAYDMNYGGLPVLYSWPSAGSTISYISDTAVVRLSGRRLSLFLEDLVAQSGAQTIHILAHSMGNRALTDALELMAARRGLTESSKPLFDQILFAAPDVDAGLFIQMMQTIRPIAKRLTLYASENDWALESSRRLHGNAPRAGQGGNYTLFSANIDSIDMSELGEDMLAHSYFADDSSALADMMALFWRNVDPSLRCGLEAKKTSAGGSQNWVYKRGQCESQTLIDIMALMQRDNVQTEQELRQMLTRSGADAGKLDSLVPMLLGNLEK
ncbi:hypothetical protein C1J03_23660 (plasmid) [Sulfitobacter sp. SK012]|uniref:alpha/beta hydrolase n=1 Tax=Sulfitobacter sp. SK012 TaxID=1389005 RepID=UPI000E0C5B71|nr:alpha/beta hydrolase [Sulfitobacter sp. SK012]AXI49115.1 hypothetical protein C1J03_23660 [Sulfitobacter sp. SK012]